MLDGTLAFNILASHSYLVAGKDVGPEEVWYTGSSLYDFYKTKDGKYLSVGSVEPNFFSAFCSTIGRPELSRVGFDSERNDELKPQISEIIASKTRDEWAEIFSQADACVEPVLTFSEAVYSQNTKERGMIVELELPNGEKVRQLANPIKFSENPAEYKWSGCVPGTHTKEVLMELGYSEDEIGHFQNEGVFN
jgi:crotonobetainyl-CoA:carnitine CoA-transferase CaiB-like acyl-CoA transferase